MTHEQTYIDLTDNPELSRRIAEAVRGEGGRVVLGTVDGPIAAVVPLDDTAAGPTGADTSAALPVPTAEEAAAAVTAIEQAAGGWVGLVDAEAFKRYIHERRRTANRPSPNL